MQVYMLKNKKNIVFVLKAFFLFVLFSYCTIKSDDIGMFKEYDYKKIKMFPLKAINVLAINLVCDSANSRYIYNVIIRYKLVNETKYCFTIKNFFTMIGFIDIGLNEFQENVMVGTMFFRTRKTSVDIENVIIDILYEFKDRNKI